MKTVFPIAVAIRVSKGALYCDFRNRLCQCFNDKQLVFITWMTC